MRTYKIASFKHQNYCTLKAHQHPQLKIITCPKATDSIYIAIIVTHRSQPNDIRHIDLKLIYQHHLLKTELDSNLANQHRLVHVTT